MSGTRPRGGPGADPPALVAVGELAGERGREEPRCQRVDADAPPAPLLRQVPGEGDQTALRRVVPRHPRTRADHAEDRRDVDHGCPGAAEQQRPGEPAQVDDRDEVEVDDPGDVAQGLVLQGPVVADAGAVDQHVEVSVPVPDGVDEGRPERGVAQVARDDQRGAGHRGRPAPQPVGAAAGEHDLGPRGAQRARDPRAQAGRGAGDEGGAACQPEGRERVLACAAHGRTS